MCEATVTDEDNEADESEVYDDPEFSLQDEGKEVSPIIKEITCVCASPSKPWVSNTSWIEGHIIMEKFSAGRSLFYQPVKAHFITNSTLYGK